MPSRRFCQLHLLRLFPVSTRNTKQRFENKQFPKRCVLLCVATMAKALINTSEKTYTLLTALRKDGPAGPKHARKRSKPACPKFVLLRTVIFQLWRTQCW